MKKKIFEIGENPVDVQIYYYDHKQTEDGKNILEIYGCEHVGVLCFVVQSLDDSLCKLTLFDKQVYDSEEYELMPCSDSTFSVSDYEGYLDMWYKNLNISTLATACKDAWTEKESKEWWVFNKLGGDDWEVVPVKSKENLEFILGSRIDEFEKEFNVSIRLEPNGEDGRGARESIRLERKDEWRAIEYEKMKRYYQQKKDRIKKEEER